MKKIIQKSPNLQLSGQLEFPEFPCFSLKAYTNVDHHDSHTPEEHVNSEGLVHGWEEVGGLGNSQTPESHW